MTTKTFAPAIATVLFSNATRHVDLVVARRAYIVIASVASEAMVTGVAGWDRVSADVAERREAQRTEYEIRHGDVVWAATQ